MATDLRILPSIDARQLGHLQTAPLPVLRYVLNSVTFDYYSCKFTANRFRLTVNTTSIPYILRALYNTQSNLDYVILKNCITFPLYCKIYSDNCLYLSFIVKELLCCYCLCTGPVRLQLIPQVHYINIATSHNNSHATIQS